MKMKTHTHAMSRNEEEELCAWYRRLIDTEKSLYVTLEKINQYKQTIAQHKEENTFNVSLVRSKRSNSIVAVTAADIIVSSAVVDDDNVATRKPSRKLPASSSLCVAKQHKEQENAENIEPNRRRSSIPKHIAKAMGDNQVEHQEQVLFQLEEKLREKQPKLRSMDNALQSMIITPRKLRPVEVKPKWENPVFKELKAGIILRSNKAQKPATPPTTWEDVGSILLRTMKSRRNALENSSSELLADEDDEQLEEFNEWEL